MVSPFEIEIKGCGQISLTFCLAFRRIMMYARNNVNQNIGKNQIYFVPHETETNYIS
jgi:hypothetical protein